MMHGPINIRVYSITLLTYGTTRFSEILTHVALQAVALTQKSSM